MQRTKCFYRHWENKPDGVQTWLSLYYIEPIPLFRFYIFFLFLKKNNQINKSEKSYEKSFGDMKHDYSLFEGWLKDECACTLLPFAASCNRGACVSSQPSAGGSFSSFSLFLAVDSPVLFVHFKFNFAFKNSIGSSVKH